MREDGGWKKEEGRRKLVGNCPDPKGRMFFPDPKGKMFSPTLKGVILRKFLINFAPFRVGANKISLKISYDNLLTFLIKTNK